MGDAGAGLGERLEPLCFDAGLDHGIEFVHPTRLAGGIGSPRHEAAWLRQGLHVVARGVTGTVEVLRRRSWRVLGTWVDLLGAIGALWACLIAVN